MKKFISIILTLTVLILFISFYAYAEEPVVLSLQDEKVYAGDEFTVNVFVSDNSQIAGAVIDINYDNDMLEFVSAKEGAILDINGNKSIRNVNNDKSYVRFTYMTSTDCVSAGGILFSVTFKILEKASGVTDLEITIPNAADLIDNNLNKITYSVENAKIYIIDNISIDTTTDSQTDIAVNDTSETESSTVETIGSSIIDNSEDNNDCTIIVLILIGIIFVCFGSILVIKKRKK